MLKPYKDEKKNAEVRRIVRALREHEGPHMTKWHSKQEKVDMIAGFYHISDAMATRVYEIHIADGYRDNIARNTYGFDKHNA